MKQIRFLSFILIILTNCMYTGGYDIVSGKKAKEKITKKVSDYSTVGTFAISDTSSFTCPVDTSNTNFTEETETNDTFKNANEATYPTSEKTTRLKGNISSSTDVDILYMQVTTAGSMYYISNSGYASCDIYISDANELTNDTSQSQYYTYFDNPSSSSGEFENLTTSNYIFLRCELGGDDTSYDVEFSLSDFSDSSSSSSSSATSSNLSTYSTSIILGQVFLNSKIDTGKKYTQSSLDTCLDKLETVVPVVSVVHINNLLTASLCGTTYVPFNEYMAAGLTCKLDEVEFIQIGDIP